MIDGTICFFFLWPRRRSGDPHLLKRLKVPSCQIMAQGDPTAKKSAHAHDNRAQRTNRQWLWDPIERTGRGGGEEEERGQGDQPKGRGEREGDGKGDKGWAGGGRGIPLLYQSSENQEVIEHQLVYNSG